MRYAIPCLVILAAAGCSQPRNPYEALATIPVEFKDDVRTNTEVSPGALDLEFIDTKGHKVDLRQFRGQKHVVLVFTRGFPGYVCPYCSTHTSRLITNYREFTRRNAEVLVVFPGNMAQVREFISVAATRAKIGNLAVPFPILLDEDFKAVDRLGLRADLAKPSTFIIDKDGKIRFAYIGRSDSDRPSIKAILAQLDLIGS